MYKTWEELESSIKGCNKCNLCVERKNIVFGTGNKNADIMFIGESPGKDEDIYAEAFVGKAGKLMNSAFEALEIKKEDVYLSNVIKCKTPQNRNPKSNEIKACMDYLRNQVILVKPKIIVLLGNIALKNILGEEYNITDLRGNWIEKKGILYMPTFHPAALLRDESKKIDFLRDLRLVKEKINE